MNLNEITTKINEGHRLIEEALAALENDHILIGDYNHKDNSIQVYDEKRLSEMFPTCIAKPRNSEYYPTVFTATCQGVEFYALSEKPFPEETTMICVSRPAQDAV
ncbi:MAG TPA: hypothetical protein DDZ44_04675 [Syntrophomonas wolfei]|uniref:Uncharacterized protein n=1 Tax=Syntrophomonas wolfei TaxID=863 RepID=A0A354YVJ7_9FIRM|nr:hypothetical protein [Syntrophomonas wolfei]